MTDVCLILEGTYPYVSGGVSTWTHDLLLAQPHLTFHLLTLVPKDSELRMKYKLPPNVTGISTITLQKLAQGARSLKNEEGFFKRLEKPLFALQTNGGLSDIRELLRVLAPHRARLGERVLLNSPTAWQMLLRMYQARHPESSFLDYFWTWRALLGGLYSVLLAELPAARVYHAVSTGYAGVLAARAHLETERPAVLTEHGIYTNERRIEIALAGWLYESPSKGIHFEQHRPDLREEWINTFRSYSRACYEAASSIVTLFEDNQRSQIEDGASPDKLRIIPNGIDFDRLSAVRRDLTPRRPTIALIGRAVPIKDVKTFICACAILRRTVPDLRALVLGPTSEDRGYLEECRNLVEHFGLGDTVEFLGRVALDEYLGRIDAIVLTSISEAQPLVILEAGAAAVPAVATDVGACRELILGRSDEFPRLGPGGEVTPIANPTATAAALGRLLADPQYRERCGRALQERVRRYYRREPVFEAYSQLYDRHGTSGGATGNRACSAGRI